MRGRRGTSGIGTAATGLSIGARVAPALSPAVWAPAPEPIIASATNATPAESALLRVMTRSFTGMKGTMNRRSGSRGQARSIFCCLQAPCEPITVRSQLPPSHQSCVWAMGKLDTIIFADCDGTVAGWTRGFTAAARLRRQLALLRQLDDHRKAGAARAAGRGLGRHRVQAQRRGLPEAQVASASRLMPPIALIARREG